MKTEKKKYLVKGIVFEAERLKNNNMKLWINGTYICELCTTVFEFHKLPTVDYISKIWDNYTYIPYYWDYDPEINYPALLEIGAFISPMAREKLNLPPRYWTIATKLCGDWSKDLNGGDYTEWENYYPVEGGYEIHYQTSSVFKFCNKCGHYGDCNCKSHQIITSLPKGLQPVY